MEKQMEGEEQEGQGELERLSPLQAITREQVLITGGSLVATGIADVFMHFNGTGVFMGLLMVFGIARHSKDIAEYLIPGSNAPQVVETTSLLVEKIAPQKGVYLDQSVGAKLKRLIGLKTPALVGLETNEDDPEVEAEEPQDEREAPEPEVEAEEPQGEREDPEPEVEAKKPRRRFRDLIDLAPNLKINKNDLAGKAIFVCGIRRHGKTTLGVRLAEQLGRDHYIPMFIPDVEGDYLSAADILPRALIAGHSRVDEEYLDYEFAALDTPQDAFQLGYDLLEVGYQVILDMNSYGSLDEAVTIQVNIIRGMFKWANDHPERRVPSCVYLDEAQRYLPQTLSDSVIKNKALVQALLDAYMDIIAIGGKRGINPVILTQRFAQVNNKIMAQTEVFFLMRQTHDGDLDRCMEYASAPITKKQISLLKPGQGIYIASDGSQIVTQFHQRESSGTRSSTPKADVAQRYATLPMARPPPGQHQRLKINAN